MSRSDSCWLYEWIDEFELYSDADVSRALKSSAAMKRLHQIAEIDSNDTTLERGDWSDLTVVAGQGMNISGDVTCGAFECLAAEVDNAISRAWHYFDGIVTSGPRSLPLKNRLENTPKKAMARLHFDIMSDVKLLRYIRDIGAESRLHFRPNNWGHCVDCTSRRAVEFGLENAASKEVRADIVAQLAEEARVSIKFERGEWSAYFSHPLLKENFVHFYDKKPTRKSLAYDVFDQHNSATVRDYVKARELGLPLAMEAQAAWLRKPKQSNKSAIEERMGRVALQLNMPTLLGVSTKDLLVILEERRPDFIRFQSALRAAIKEAIVGLDTKSDDEIAISVHRDFIEPELQRIQSNLQSIKSSFSKKLASGAGIGAITTGVGLISSMPLVIATGVAAAATLVPQVYKFLDDRSAVETSDMYFLWDLKARVDR